MRLQHHAGLDDGAGGTYTPETILDKARFDAVVDICAEEHEAEAQRPSVEAFVIATKPRRRRPPIAPNPRGAGQLAAVLAACSARDTYRGQAANPPNSPDVVAAAKRQHQRSLEGVVTAFDKTLKGEAKTYATVDSCGRRVEFEDALQTARLGLVDAVDRYDAERGSAGCVWFVTQRIKYTLQQSLLHTKRKPRQEVHVDWSRADADSLPRRQHGDELWAPPAAATSRCRVS